MRVKATEEVSLSVRVSMLCVLISQRIDMGRQQCSVSAVSRVIIYEVTIISLYEVNH